MALISIKDVKQAIHIMMQILEKLDEIYHALHDSINENEKELFFGYVLQLCHVIKFFGHFAEAHEDKAMNLSMIKKVFHS